MIASQVCRDGVRKAKAQLELNMASDLKDNKNSFYNYIKSKRKTKENVHGVWSRIWKSSR